MEYRADTGEWVFNTDAKRRKKKNCVKSTSCGNSCISQTKTCWANMTPTQKRKLKALGLKGEEQAAKSRELAAERKARYKSRKENKEIEARIAKAEKSLNEKLSAFKPKIFEKAIASVEKIIKEAESKAGQSTATKKASKVVSLAERRAQKVVNNEAKDLRQKAQQEIDNVRSKVVSINKNRARTDPQTLNRELSTVQKSFETSLNDLAKAAAGKGGDFSKGLEALSNELSQLESVVATMNKRSDSTSILDAEQAIASIEQRLEIY